MSAASKMFGQEKANNLSKLYDMAMGIMNAANNPQEVVKKAGITRADIEKAKALMNNPFSNWAVSALGGDKESIIKGLTIAEQFVEPLGVLPEQAPVSDLEALRKDLKQLR